MRGMFRHKEGLKVCLSFFFFFFKKVCLSWVKGGKKVYRYIAKNLTYITPCKNKNSIDMKYILF